MKGNLRRDKRGVRALTRTRSHTHTHIHTRKWIQTYAEWVWDWKRHPCLLVENQLCCNFGKTLSCVNMTMPTFTVHEKETKNSKVWCDTTWSAGKEPRLQPHTLRGRLIAQHQRWQSCLAKVFHFGVPRRLSWNFHLLMAMSHDQRAGIDWTCMSLLCEILNIFSSNWHKK